VAQKVTVVLVDDLDGSEASETVQFGLDGKNYEIDLNEENAQKLRDAIAPWMGHARLAEGGTRRRTARAPDSSSTNLKEVREWAGANGHEVSDRGRVSAAVQEAYDAAH